MCITGYSFVAVMKRHSSYPILLLLVIFCCGNSVHAQSTARHIVWDTLITGHCSKAEVRRHEIYVPFHVGAGITGLNMQAWVTDPKENVLDIGIFDERGAGPGPHNGFRGWAGGNSNKAVHITKAHATSSYIPGPINEGTWQVLVIPTRIDKQGFDWRLKISLEAGGDNDSTFVMHPAREVVNHRQGWYRGDLHIHDVNSDGVYTQQEVVQLAKAAGLQFMIPTNHNTYAANLNWGLYDSDSLLILNGEEVTPMQENHWNAIGINPTTWIDWRYDAPSGRIAQYQQQVRDAGGLCVANHPFYDNDTIVDTHFPITGFDAIEVWNGPWDKRDDYGVAWWDSLLNKGIIKTAIGASDSHRHDGNNEVGTPQTIVHADGLNRKDIIAAIRRGKCYVAVDKNVVLDIKAYARGKIATIGDTLPGAASIRTTIAINGVVPNSVLTIISNKGILYTKIGLKKDNKISTALPAAGVKYLRIEVRTADQKMQALTNPIWIK